MKTSTAFLTLFGALAVALPLGPETPGDDFDDSLTVGHITSLFKGKLPVTCDATTSQVECKALTDKSQPLSRFDLTSLCEEKGGCGLCYLGAEIKFPGRPYPFTCELTKQPNPVAAGAAVNFQQRQNQFCEGKGSACPPKVAQCAFEQSGKPHSNVEAAWDAIVACAECR